MKVISGPNENEDYHARLDLFTQQELEAMETLVELKMEQRMECTLITMDYDSVVAQLVKVIV